MSEFDWLVKACEYLAFDLVVHAKSAGIWVNDPMGKSAIMRCEGAPSETVPLLAAELRRKLKELCE